MNDIGRRALLRLYSIALMPAVVRAALRFALEERRIAKQSENTAVNGIVQRRLAPSSTTTATKGLSTWWRSILASTVTTMA